MKALWKTPNHRHRPQNSPNIRGLYKNRVCAVVVDDQLSEWFEVLVGLRQSCLLYPTLLSFFLEFIIRELSELDQTLVLTDTFSPDIRYTDDTKSSENSLA